MEPEQRMLKTECISLKPSDFDSLNQIKICSLQKPIDRYVDSLSLLKSAIKPPSNCTYLIVYHTCNRFIH